MALERELRCEVLRDAQGAVVGRGAGFADSLPAVGQRAAVLVTSGYQGDGTYEPEGKGERASVQLVVWISAEPCPPGGGCLSGIHPAQVTLQDGGLWWLLGSAALDGRCGNLDPGVSARVSPRSYDALRDATRFARRPTACSGCFRSS